MRKVLIFFILIFLIGISCSEKCYVECIGEEPYLYFSIVNEIDSTDLVFGNGKIYDANAISAFSIDSEDTITYEIRSNIVDLSGNRLLTLEFLTFDVSTIYLDYGNADVDTLGLDFITIDSECCGRYQRINAVSQNGHQIFEFVDDFRVYLVK